MGSGGIVIKRARGPRRLHPLTRAVDLVAQRLPVQMRRVTELVDRIVWDTTDERDG